MPNEKKNEIAEDAPKSEETVEDAVESSGAAEDTWEESPDGEEEDDDDKKAIPVPLPDGDLDEPDSETGKKKDKKRVLVIILLLLALCLAGAGGYMLWRSQQPDLDPGATIQETTKGKTTKEIQAELDKIAEKSRMTISVAPTVTLKNGKARVNVINVKDNRFDQKFTLKQDGTVVYRSGVIKRGHKVEWCKADGLKEGTATLTVQAVNRKTGKASGNPQSVDVKVVKYSKASK